MGNATEFIWTVHETPEGPFVAVCDALSATVEADTMDELKKNAQEATELVISARFDELVAAMSKSGGGPRRRAAKGGKRRETVISSHSPAIQIGQLQAA